MTQIGTVIDGKYRVIEKVGEGGMSIVWLVTDSRLNKQWAVKEIKKNARTETHKVIVDSLRKEANLMKGLDHPALPRIVDIIEDGRSVYVVMDFIQGQDLLTVMKEKRRTITEADVIDWGIQLCDALTYLHNQGIVYRDMKPGNVMLLEDGTVKIIDFGIAREYSPDKEDDTMPLGTRGYASPEAFKRGVQTDPRSDIYSLGVTLFHLVTGHGPMEYVDQPTLPRIRSINPNLSPGLEYVISKSTRWNPDRRYQSCNAMRYDLENPPDPAEQKRLRRIMTIFKGLAIACVACLALGIGLMIVSNLVRGSSYDGIMAQAASANANEDIEGARPSMAEQLYMEAIDMSPGVIEPYSKLVNEAYKASGSFSEGEGTRWNNVFNANKNRISGSNEYAKLCYDAGIDYLLYYRVGQEDEGKVDDMTRAELASSWFTYAIDDYDARNGNCTLSVAQRKAAEAYRVIGGFKKVIEQAIREGNDGEAYREYWNALQDMLAETDNSASLASGEEAMPVIARLRLYRLMFTAVRSQSYLRGFANAGIGQAEVEAFLADVESGVESLKTEAELNSATKDIYDYVMSEMDKAEESIKSTYENGGARGGRSSGTTTSQSERRSS